MCSSTSDHEWCYTWEAQSHIPTLRLMLFPNNKTLNPSLQCNDLTINLHSSHAFLTLTSSSISLRVPLPAVLVDDDSPLTFRPLSDHIEVKLRLLLPVDHPILSTLDSSQTPPTDPLVSESDVNKLSSAGEVDFYCRTCAFKLTKTPLRNFVEMPSVNWREIADNWFGNCCCSFGGISEKMVMKYVSSYTCAPGICLLSSTSVTLSKDDLVDCNFAEGCGERDYSSVAENPRDDGVGKGARNCELNGERTSTCTDGGVGTKYEEQECGIAENPRDDGICLLSSTSVTLSKDDLVDCNFAEGCGERDYSSVAENPRDDGVGKGARNCELNGERTSTCTDGGVGTKCEEQECGIAENPKEDGVGKDTRNYDLNGERTSTCCDDGGPTVAFDNYSRIVYPEDVKLSVNLKGEITKSKPDHGDFSDLSPDSNDAEDLTQASSCCSHMPSNLENGDGEHNFYGTVEKGDMPTETTDILGNQKSFLNGYLEDVFMARLSNLSKDIDWREFTCPQCTSLLGTYPCCEGNTPVDGGVRLFKCYISTHVPVGGPGDMFSKYIMGKMFANLLMECASDESSFRFVIRDLTTKSPVLQIILLNPDTWFCFGFCSSTEDKDPVPKLKLQPIIKVLFSDCHNATESQLRMIEEWATKSSAENIFMLPRQTQDLVGLLISAKDLYPPSCASLQGLILSSVQR